MKYMKVAARCTPEELHRHLKGFLPLFRGLAATVITVPAAKSRFNAAVESAMVILDRTPSVSTCSELESLFDLMAVLFVDAPLLKSKPRDQVKEVIGWIEELRAGLSFVSREWHRYH
ncbi:hypothetical protein [Paraburkholderia sp. J7]|uniref:hypothetical protein n=1 Tax=Paraburkholderia sp. J7 TaxID=2805438 RepID=UPI002AB61A43|nr:hypothetical protein [Paraburkholderia sp. J7]